jgi:hypothetical protein
VVVDIGCGDGRDSYAFARDGRAVVGLDRAAIGVAHAARKAEALGHASARFVACDVGDADQLGSVLRQVRADHPGQPVLFYTRFFLHAITEPVQGTLLSVVDEVAADGDVFAAEFRTDRDERAEKVHGRHYRRFQNGPAFGDTLQERHRFAVRIEQEGNGFSPYRGEDPQLYRVIAVRAGRDEIAAAARRRGRPSRTAQAPAPGVPGVPAEPAAASAAQLGGRRQRLLRTVARDYAPPVLVRWARARRAGRR